jgi:hypothetical protein
VASRLGGDVPVGSASKRCLFMPRIALLSDSLISNDATEEWGMPLGVQP